MRGYNPILEIGQNTRATHAFTLYDLSERPYEPIDLTNASEVRLSMNHQTWGGTAVDGGVCTIPDQTASEGYVEYEFSPEETSNYGTHYIQFEIDWTDGTTELVPPEGTDWTLFIGLRLPNSSPLRAGTAIFEDLSVGTAEIGQLTAQLDAGGYTLRNIGDATHRRDATPKEYVDSVVGENLEGASNPATADYDFNSYKGINLAAPTNLGDAARLDETQANADDISVLQTDVDTLGTDKADADGAGTAELLNYAFIDTDRVRPGRTEYGENPAETISGTGATLSFSATEDRDAHDSTDVTLSNGTTGSITEDVTVDYYEGVDNTGTLLASGTQSITLAADASTTATFLADDFTLGTGDHFIEVSTTNLTADGIDEHTLGLQYTVEPAANGDLVTTDQSGQERARYAALSDTVSFPAVQADDVTASHVSAGSADTDDLQTRDLNGIIFAHHYDTAQAAVDASTDASVVVFLREYGPYEPFTIPPRDGLYLYSPNRAVIETSLTTGDTATNEAIIDGPENHSEYTGSRFYDPTPVTGSVSAGDDVITVDNPGQFSQGDIAFLAAGDELWRTYSSWSANNLRGEYVTISDVNADTVEIAELGPMVDYSNPNGNLSLYKFNAALTNSTIEGFELHGAYEPANHPDDTYSERGFVLNGAHSVELRDVHIQNAGRAGCDLRGCYEVEVNDLTVDTVGRYGLVILEECKAVDATGLNVSRSGRYASQIGAPTSDSYAPTQAIKITGATARDCHLYGYNIHPNGYNITLRSCDGINVNGGIRVRSEKVTLDGGRFELGSGQMIRGQHRCSGLRVRNVDCNPSSQFARFDGTDDVDDIRIEGCTTYGERDIAPSAIMLTHDTNVTYGDIKMVDCDIPTLRRYQPIVDITTDATVTGTVSLEGCTFEGSESVAETSTGATVTGELIIDGCWIADAGDGFASFAPTDRVVFIDNRLRNTSISNPGDTIAWSGNLNITT